MNDYGFSYMNYITGVPSNMNYSNMVNPNDYMDVYFKPPISLVIKNVFSSICAIILAIIVLVGTL